MGNLKVAFALLPDRELANRVSAAALAAHGATGGRLRWPRMPSHLSLTQPFAIESLPPVERYFDQLAKELEPIVVTLGGIEIQPPSANGPEAVVWVGVRACPALLEVHERLQRDLGAVVTDASAPFEGDGYRFHMTLGFLPAANLTSSDHLPQFEGAVATLGELGMFLYDGLPRAGWQCMLYGRRSLGNTPARVDEGVP
jgi:2'-5' RNA ligase